MLCKKKKGENHCYVESVQPVISFGPSDYLIVTYFSSSPSLLLGAEAVSFKRKPPGTNGGLGWALRFIAVCASVGIVSHHYQVHFFHWGSADHSVSQLASLGFLEELPFLFKIK